MKKIIAMVAVLSLMVVVALAGMDDVTFTATSLAPGNSQTNSFVMRGLQERIEFTTSADSSIVSNTVVVTSGNATLFTKACTNDATYFPRIQVQDTTGTSIGGTNNPFEKAAVAGLLTVVQSAIGPATNTYTVKIVYQK